MNGFTRSHSNLNKNILFELIQKTHLDALAVDEMRDKEKRILGTFSGADKVRFIGFQ